MFKWIVGSSINEVKQQAALRSNRLVNVTDVLFSKSKQFLLLCVLFFTEDGCTFIASRQAVAKYSNVKSSLEIFLT